MPRFIDLPNELWLQILQYLLPPDFGSFYCVSKKPYSLTVAHRRKHQSLKLMFSTALSTKQPGSTARLIKQILDDPQIALYVQHYTIDGYRYRWGFGYDDGMGNVEPRHVEYPSSDMAQLELAMWNSEYLAVHEKETWTFCCLKNGEEDGLIAFALTLFPNLTSIELQDPGYLTSTLRGMFCRIAESKRSGGALANLVSVNISASDSSSFVGPDAIELFATLPSVKIINADRVDGTEGLVGNGRPMIRSTVTDLNLSHGNISPKRLAMLLLQNFEGLQSFTYWPARESQGEHGFDAYWIVTALLACARDSLRELHIRAGFIPGDYMGSLQKFRVLEYVETETSLLFGRYHAVKDFRSTLPLSIREVKLHWCDRRAHFNQPLLTRINCGDLPNLSSIELFGAQVPADEVAQFQDICASINVSLKDVGDVDVPLPRFTRHRGHYVERQAKKALANKRVL